MCANTKRSSEVAMRWLCPHLLLLLCFTPASCYSNNNNLALFNSYRNVSDRLNPLRFRDFAPRVALSGNARSFNADANANAHADTNIATSIEEFVAKERRSARGIHFQADGRDLSIDLEFIVPFMRIPIERSVQVTQTAFRKLVDLNAGTLLLSGVVVVVGAAVGGVVKFLTARAAHAHSYDKKTRAVDATSGVMDAFNFVSYVPAENGSAPTKTVAKVHDMLESLELKLQQHDVNVSACAQRVICGYVQRAVVNASPGAGGSPVARIVDGLISLDMLKPYLQDTALHRAIEVGRKRDADICVLTYAHCNWSNLQSRAWKVLLEYLQHFAGRNG